MKVFIVLFCASAFCLATASLNADASEPQAADPSDGSPYPLKSARTTITDEEVAAVRENVEAYEKARQTADHILREAKRWLDWSDEAIRDLMPGGEVPRAFNVGTAGCPTCGDAIYEEAGTYPWIIRREEPFKVTCPICEKSFPDNDFAAYLESGMSNEDLVEGEFADDGWGWVGPDGHRYWFVAHANHEMWKNVVNPAWAALAQSYVITGDPRYAHKAAVMLTRVAEVYPGMDYRVQSRYGAMQDAVGARPYHGKIVNKIWETNMLTNLAVTYDYVWDAIDEDEALQRLTGRSGRELREQFEHNVLEAGIQAVYDGKIVGNFGMHQQALAYAAVVRQHGPTEKWLEDIVWSPGPSISHLGLEYALYNLIYRDGHPYETAPGYNRIWISKFASLSRVLDPVYPDLFHKDKMRAAYEAPLNIVNIGKFTPSLGDSGSVYGTPAAPWPSLFRTAYELYGDERSLLHLKRLDAVGNNSFTDSFGSLIREPLDTPEGAPAPLPARLYDGYGMSILSNPADTVSASMYYGLRGGHGHYDRLSFELFAEGQPLMPDLGYPDFMNIYVPGIYTWSKNTVAHNTVVVDAGRAGGNVEGKVQLFADGPFARVMDVAAEDTYAQTDQYRRHMVMVDVDATTSYYVDLFSVSGGEQHDYVLHGPPGEATLHGEWSSPAEGTLAGPDVEVGEIYDSPTLAAPDYDGGYQGYAGSGFQHLMHPQRLQSDDFIAEFVQEKASDARLRIRILPQPDQQIIAADARVSPVKHPELIKYIIARREGAAGLSSRFVSVLEPYGRTPYIQSVSRIAVEAEGAEAVRIKHASGMDLVLLNPRRETIVLDDHAVETAAHTAIVCHDEAGVVKHVFFAGADSLKLGGEQLQAQRGLMGEVVEVDPHTETVRVRVSRQAGEADKLAGAYAHFTNRLRRTVHPIASVREEGGDVILEVGDTLRIGRLRIAEAKADAITTGTPFMVAPTYDGARIADKDLLDFLTLEQVRDGVISLVEPLPAEHGFRAGDDAWIINVGPGDQVEIPFVGGSEE